MYHQFNIQQFYALPTQCIYVFCMDLRICSDYFPIQHQLSGFYNRDGVFTEWYGLDICVLCGSENKQRLFPYTELTGWFFIIDTESV